MGQENTLEIPPHPRWDLAIEKPQDCKHSSGSSLGAPSALLFSTSVFGNAQRHNFGGWENLPCSACTSVPPSSVLIYHALYFPTPLAQLNAICTN